MPETPHWLAQKNRAEEAVRSLTLLRGLALQLYSLLTRSGLIQCNPTNQSIHFNPIFVWYEVWTYTMYSFNYATYDSEVIDIILIIMIMMMIMMILECRALPRSNCQTEQEVGELRDKCAHLPALSQSAGDRIKTKLSLFTSRSFLRETSILKIKEDKLK